MKIVTIEDDVFFQKFYSTQLRDHGYDITVASNGVEGLQKIKEIKPDLILLDIIMPEKDGFEVLEELKKDPQLMHIPVLIFSTLGQEADVAKAKSLGAVDCINKSFFDLDKLLSTITRVTTSPQPPVQQ
jgi:CheY-like chemotaxis protein